MNEIKCPKCGTVFQINETDYDSIVKQIRNHELEREIKRLEEEYKKDKNNSIQLAEAKLEKKLKEELQSKELEINSLKNELKTKEENTKNSLEKEYIKSINEKEKIIQDLESKIKISESENKLAIQNALHEKEKEMDNLNSKLTIQKKEAELLEKNLKESYEEKIKTKDEQIAYYKDFKAKQSTKMIGESLEKHCSYEFNKL